MFIHLTLLLSFVDIDTESFVTIEIKHIFQWSGEGLIIIENNIIRHRRKQISPIVDAQH